MSDLLSRGADFFSTKRKATLALEVTYTTSSGQVVTGLLATYAQHTRQMTDVGTQVTGIEAQHDFIVARADLPADPEANDQIETDQFADGQLRRFKVLGFAGLPAVEDSDPYKYEVRLHCQEVPQ